MPTLAEIENLARDYDAALADLNAAVNALQEELDDARTRHLPTIRDHVTVVTCARDELLAAVHAAPDAFKRPKSHVFHRIKVGWRKAAGKVEIANEAKTVDAIRRWFPARFVRLVKVTEKPNKAELAKLPGRDLKKLGVQVTEDIDEAFVKPVDGEVEKLAAALVNGDGDE